MAKNQPNYVLITQEHIHFINFGCFCYGVLLFWNADVIDYLCLYSFSLYSYLSFYGFYCLCLIPRDGQCELAYSQLWLG